MTIEPGKFYEYYPSHWIKKQRDPDDDVTSFNDLLTEEEKNDKFFSMIWEQGRTLLDIVQTAGLYLSSDLHTCLNYLGPLTVNNAWQYRLLLRVGNGAIKPVVWHDQAWWRESNLRFDQLPYISEKDPSKIAYTPNEEYGRANRQVMIKVGKYLNQNFSEKIDSNTIRFWANRHSELYGNHKLRFAITGDDIEWVYEHGPLSCMVIDRDNRYIESDIHPVRVYESPDTAVAYLLKPNCKDRVMARTVVNTKHKQWTTIYGESHVLESLLKQEGYEMGNLQGCRLKAITDHTGEFLCPYLDGSATNINILYDNDKRWLEVTQEEGEYIADTTSGYLTNRHTFYCECCREDRHEDERTSTHSDGDICESCVTHHYTLARISTDHHYEEYIHNESIIYVLMDNGEEIPWYDNIVTTEPDIFIEHNGDYMTKGYYEEHYEQEEAA